MGEKALLVIDMLNDFVKKEYGSGAYSDRGANVISKIKTLAYAAAKNDIPVIYCSDAHLKSDHELVRWGEHAMHGSRGSKVISELPTDDMLVFEREENKKTIDSKLKEANKHRFFNVEKGTYSAFYGTPLDALLKKLDVDTIYVTGLHTNICDTHTSAGAFFRGYNIIVVNDGVDALTQEDHERGLKNLEFSYAAVLRSTEDCLADFASR